MDPKRWLSPRALLLHLAVVTVATGCLVAAWWQVGRARSGNWLSYAYAVEWPAFAVLAFVGWWHFIHDDDRTAIRARRAERDAARSADRVAQHQRRRVEEESDGFREYNDYLQTLAASGTRKSWRNPRGL